VQRAILEGETETGVSIIRLVQKMDAGPILLKKVIPINQTMNVTHLFDQVAQVGKEALLETIDLIDKGHIQEEIQDELKVTFAPKISKEEEILAFNESAAQLDRRIKAIYPYAYFTIKLRGQEMKLFCLDSQVVDYQLQEKEIFSSTSRLIIGTKTGSLEILKLKQEGRKELTAEEWLRSAFNHFTFTI
jgi:methionyl-tRNA formyltransferase